MIPYKTIFLFAISVFSISCTAQTSVNSIYSEIEVGVVPDLKTFQHLTAYEVRMDSLLEKQNGDALKRLLDGSAFIKGTPKGIVDKAIQEQKELNEARYRDNRSRYKLQLYKNGELQEEQNEDLDSVGTECGCFLNGNTIEVRMGIWIFGGFGVSADLVGRKFTSSYWVDTHEQNIYKLNPKDSALTDEIGVPAIEQQLILDSVPRYEVGQQLTGYLTFKTAKYFRSADYEDGLAKDEYSDMKMDKLYTKGVVHFTCKVRRKTQEDE